MAGNWSGWCWQLGLASSLAIGGAIANSSECAFAQLNVIPDNTLGTQVAPDQTDTLIDRIEGGTQKGANLFHSFSEFNVRQGRAVDFANPAEVENILSRVTGNDPSDILGTLRVLGNANLFLINPNGIIFGPDARLDVNGSFLASTASSLIFGDRTQFSATTDQTTPLLTVNVPIGLQFGGTAGGIRVQGSGLEVQPGQTLALVGGDVTLSGGELAATGGTNLAAPGGRIELGSVAENGEVSLNQRGSSWVIGYDRAGAFRDIKLEDGAYVDASGESGGDIQVATRQLNVREGAQIFAGTSGEGQGGNLTVTASESVELIGRTPDGQYPSGLFAETDGAGAAGNLTITTERLSVREGARVSTVTAGEGQGGNLSVTASESVELIGRSPDGQEPSGLFTRTDSAGNAGNLMITTGRLSVREGAQVFAGTEGEGQGGNLSVTALESVELLGRSPDGQEPSGLFTQSEGSGNAGDLEITTRRLNVGDGAQVSAATFGSGSAGELRVNATESVNLFGVGINRGPSGLFTRTAGEGQGGNIIVDTSAFRVADNAIVDARTLSTGNGGNITVKANTFEAVNGGQILASAFRSSSGSAGNITVNTTDSVTISGSAPFKRLVRIREDQFVEDESATSGLFVLSQGLGDAGKLELTAGSIRLDNKGEITAESNSGQGGDIKLQAQNLLRLGGESKISTTAGAGGNGGNITIDTPFLIAVPSEDSDITANANLGNGGFIQITTQGIFGIERREQLTPLSDITAISQQNPELNGVVEINSPDVDPSQGLVTLPAELVEASNQIASSCADGGESVTSNEFTITGRGGLPPNPREPLGGEAVLTNWATLEGRAGNREQGRAGGKGAILEQGSRGAGEQIVEAQGWVINDKGEVVLTATAPTVTSNNPWLNAAACHQN